MIFKVIRRARQVWICLWIRLVRSAICLSVMLSVFQDWRSMLGRNFLEGYWTLMALEIVSSGNSMGFSFINLSLQTFAGILTVTTRNWRGNR